MTDLPELVSAPSACLEQQHPIIRLNHNSKTRNHLLRFVYRLTGDGRGTGVGRAKPSIKRAVLSTRGTRKGLAGHHLIERDTHDLKLLSGVPLDWRTLQVMVPFYQPGLHELKTEGNRD